MLDIYDLRSVDILKSRFNHLVLTHLKRQENLIRRTNQQDSWDLLDKKQNWALKMTFTG